MEPFGVAAGRVGVQVDGVRVEAAGGVAGGLGGFGGVLGEVAGGGGVGQLTGCAASALYRRLAHPGMPGWARLLVEHIDRWITTSGHSGSMQHDPLALSVAMGLPFVTLASAHISVDRRGRMCHDLRGVVWHSQSADYPGFRRWLADTITHRLPAANRGTYAS